MRPKLSICIPTYNRADMLKEALDSVLMQLGGDIKADVLISDNASTDNTQEMVDQYQRRSPFIRYQRNPENIGFDGNIVSCIKHACGEYIWFLSDDDILLNGTLERVMEEIKTHNPTILYLNHTPFMNDSSKKMKPMNNTKDKSYYDGKEFFLNCGLGFISSLILRTDYAKEFSTYGVNSLYGEAHLEIASRIALKKNGPFIFLGSVSIAARLPSQLANDYFTCHRLNADKLYKKLEGEGLLDTSTVRLYLRNVINVKMLRAMLYNKCIGNHLKLAEQKDEILQLYGDHKIFYLYIYPFMVMPRWLLILPYVILRQFVRQIRRLKYA